jgi:oxygen-independent coproporphyrinogen-3 oxidase
MTRLEGLLTGTPYAGYAYAYPHKTAYRRLDPPVPLAEAWAEEPRDAVFLYAHIPFCEMRCGFCNLFTTTHPREGVEARYLTALTREAHAVREAVGPVRVAQVAIGGGTPTYLSPRDLEALFDLLSQTFDVDLSAVPTAIETSPLTATDDRLRILRDRGAARVSIGVQSFIEAEAAAAGRAQKRAVVESALERIRISGIPCLNIDLMYGLPGQTVESWLVSLKAALQYQPEELYLYPLYVRPLTGLGRRGAETWDAQRLACYRTARELLLDRGYAQRSMRHFERLPPAPPRIGGPGELTYACQEDAMIGLGCGARSYTQALHYSSEYAVGRVGVREILAAYLDRDAAAFARAEYGIRLEAGEQRRRYVLKSLLHADGLDLTAYRERYGSEAQTDFSELGELGERELAQRIGERLQLTPRGLEYSDALGPWLYSDAMRARMEAFPLR